MSTRATNPEQGLNAAVAAELRHLREERHLTVRDLSAASGVPLRTLVRLLAGERAITFETLCALADAQGVSVSTIVERAEERARDAQRVPQFSA